MTAALVALAILLAADPRSQLSTLERRREAEATAARLLADQERSVFDELQRAEEAAARAKQELAQAEQAKGEAQRALAEAAAAEVAAAGRLDAQLDLLRPRLAARARMGRAGELAVLLSAPSLAEAVKRHALFDRILLRDAVLVSGARQAWSERERARAAREAEAARLAAAAVSLVEVRQQAQARREERESLLAARGEPRGAGGFARRKGKLPLPAPGPITVGFGKVVNPRFNTVTVQKGIDIRAGEGAEVRTIGTGTVVFSGWLKGYGNLVIVDHGSNFHSLYAHLANTQVDVGNAVEEGEAIGQVGDTGSLKGSYLYFEIRKGGQAVDPLPWLKPEE